MQDGARLCAEHYRDMAAHFRSLAGIEPLASLRRHLRRLAAQHDEVAAHLEVPHVGEQDAPRTPAESPLHDRPSELGNRGR